MPTSTFQLFSPQHCAVLVAVLLVAGLMIGLALAGSRFARWAEITLASMMAITWPAYAWRAWRGGFLDWGNALPLHYCEAGAIVAVVALITRRSRWAEIAYFAGLAGVLQGLLTPSLVEGFPAWEFFRFFLYHGGGVITALYVVLGWGLRPGWAAWRRMIGWGLLYVAVVGVVNFFSGSNYAFLREKPPSPTIMDPLGAWPGYVGWLIVISVAYYALLALPFTRSRNKHCARKQADH
jgi:hypothetical integral membrane protein (TIGR02206 family)